MSSLSWTEQEQFRLIIREELQAIKEVPANHEAGEVATWREKATDYGAAADEAESQVKVLCAKVKELSEQLAVVTADRDTRHENSARIKELEAEVERLKDENACLQRDLEQKAGEIGRAEHRGNTVDYIYDKCKLYGEQLSSQSAAYGRMASAVAAFIVKTQDVSKVTGENEMKAPEEYIGMLKELNIALSQFESGGEK